MSYNSGNNNDYSETNLTPSSIMSSTPRAIVRKYGALKSVDIVGNITTVSGTNIVYTSPIKPSVTYAQELNCVSSANVSYRCYISTDGTISIIGNFTSAVALYISGVYF